MATRKTPVATRAPRRKTPVAAAAGWYEDAAGKQRYWDGRKWVNVPAPKPIIVCAPRSTHNGFPQRSFRCPEDVWRAAKREAALRGETITDALMRSLRRYGQKHL